MTRYNIYSFCVRTHSLENYSFIYLSYITIAAQGGIFKQFFYKNNYKFLRYVRTICPKIFTKLDYFSTVSQMGVAYFALKIFWAFLTFSQLRLAYPVLKTLGNWKKNTVFIEWKITWQYYLKGRDFLAIIY